MSYSLCLPFIKVLTFSSSFLTFSSLFTCTSPAYPSVRASLLFLHSIPNSSSHAMCTLPNFQSILPGDVPFTCRLLLCLLS
ncbi:hypothetical protein K469DRAFT_111276 [Zopfia rhizophila CBS 207.26]|uniref:Secreted protein n=1 Tax=Zopfia rhizophila CBS 207.26 TaxID=1314779 RepID=A0A6A6E5U5_9PEZI|nr:hypothetical protein K469DRAFT_111276 [Zopfia rhizophila CBS 207.26]